MSADSVTPGSGVILLSTKWRQSGLISGSTISYNYACPEEPSTGNKCLTGCTNTAAAQILYYWLENSDFTLELQLTVEDSYVSKYDGVTISIDSTAETAEQNGYLSFAEVNQSLADFTVGDAFDIAALNFACGVVQKAGYSSTATSTAWKDDLFRRAGMSGCTFLTSSSNPYFYESENVISSAVFDVLIAELLAGHPVGTSYPGHALVIDGYDSTTDKFHINYGWGGYKNSWYSRDEISETGYYYFLLDITPDYDGSPILVTSSAAYGVGTLIRGMEQLSGIFEADTLTIVTDGISVTLKNAWRCDKAITINNLNADVTSSYGIIYNTDNLTVNGLSGNLKTDSSQGIYAKGDLTVNGLSGSVSSSSNRALSSSGNISVTGLSGSVSSDSYYGLSASGNVSISGLSGTVSSSSSRAVNAAGDIVITDLSGTVSASQAAIYASGNVSITGLSGNISSSAGACIIAVKDLAVSGLSGVINSVASTGLSASGNLELTDFSGSVKAASRTVYSGGTAAISNASGQFITQSSAGSSAYAIMAKTLSLQNFSGICLSVGSNSSFYALRATNGKLEAVLNGGRIFAGTCSSEAGLDTLIQDLSLRGAAGVEKAVLHNEQSASKSTAVSATAADDDVLLKNHATLQGSIYLADGNDTVSILGGSLVYAPAVSCVEVLNLDSTSGITGDFYGSGTGSMTINVIITQETPAAEIIRVQSYLNNLCYYLKDKTLNIDLRAAADGEYVLVNGAGCTNAEYYLSSLSADIDTGSGSMTLKCNESSSGVSLKYENESLVLVLDGYAQAGKEAMLFAGETLLAVEQTVGSRTISSAAEADSLRLVNGGTAESITVNAGGDLAVSNSGTASGTAVNKGGILAVNQGGTAKDTTVYSGGCTYVSSGGTHSGFLQIADDASVTVYQGAIIDFALTEQTAGNEPLINDWSLISGGADADYTITVSDDQSIGVYLLAAGAGDFAETVALNDESGSTLGTLDLGVIGIYGDYTYALNCEDDLLSLTIDNKPMFCRSSWTAGEAVSVTWQDVVYSGEVGDGFFFNDYTQATAAAAETGQSVIVTEEGTKTTPVHYDACDAVISGSDAVYQRMVLGGKLISGKNSYSGSYTLSIESGTFNSEIAGGDAGNSYVDRTGDITFNISGGTFNGNVLGGGYYAGGITGSYTLEGDVNLTISGGSFAQRIYAGCGAITESTSSMVSMEGNVYLTIDASENTINFGEHVAAGNRGKGLLLGSTNVTVTGLGSNLNFADTSILFGGCGGDCYKTTGGVRKEATSVIDPVSLSKPGMRALTFDDFSGDFKAEISMFSDISFINGTDMNFADAELNLKDVSTWNFDCGCFAGNLNQNEFTGDVLNVDVTGLSGSWTLLAGDSAAFDDLTAASCVYFSGSEAVCSGGVWSDGTYSLAVEENAGKSSLIVSKLG